MSSDHFGAGPVLEALAQDPVDQAFDDFLVGDGLIQNGPMPQTSTPERMVPTRRISFEKSLQDVPKHFAADGDLITSHLAAALSAVFPDGEDFFVRSVRHFRDQVMDPELKRQVAGFIG